jgi:hypothetical protein
MKNVSVLILTILLLGFSVNITTANVYTFTDQTAYLNAVASYNQIYEDFENGTVWPKSNEGDATVSSVTSQGINWSGNDGILTGRNGYYLNPTYYVFDNETGLSEDNADAIFLSSSLTLFGVGGYFTNSIGAYDIHFDIDGSEVFDNTFTKDWVDWTFLGILDTDGFTTAKIYSNDNDGNWFADNFTLATSTPVATPIPPAILLLGSGLVGVAGFRKRFFKK